MYEVKAPVPRAVIYPPTFFFAPFNMAALNFGVHSLVILLTMWLLDVAPLPILVSMIGCHIALAVYGARNPHLYTWMQSIGRQPSQRDSGFFGRSGAQKTKNLIFTENKKYVP